MLSLIPQPPWKLWPIYGLNEQYAGYLFKNEYKSSKFH